MTTSVATREEDLKQLGELLGDHADELSETEAEAFDDMRVGLLTEWGHHQLTDKQRAWLTVVRARLVPQYENLVSRGLVPRGKEVPTPAVLQHLPKRPPTRRTPER